MIIPHYLRFSIVRILSIAAVHPKKATHGGILLAIYFSMENFSPPLYQYPLIICHTETLAFWKRSNHFVFTSLSDFKNEINRKRKQRRRPN
jgi:hypothetical protein